jgi:hypothetical protein
MKLAKLSLGLGLVGLATVSMQAAVRYVGNNVDGDVTTIISLNPLSINGTTTTEAAFEALYGGDYVAAAGTQAATWTWAAADTFILQELIFITNGTLSIEAGSIVRAQPDAGGNFNPGALTIARGAKIVAPGNPAAPIIFTSASTTVLSSPTRATGSNPTFWDNDPVGAPKSPLIAAGWGGLAILGNAPVNSDRDGAGLQDYFDVTGNTAAISNGTAVTGTRSVQNDDRFSLEGVPPASLAFTSGVDRFGGFNPTENSGVLTYVSLRHGGANLTLNNELNGLTLGAVGSGTTINHIEIWGNTDDGVEIFGGSVNLQYVAIFGVQDDGLDLDVGYTGTVQFLFVVAGGTTDKLGEWDGSYASETSINGGSYATGPVSPSLNPVASFTVANATLIGNSNGSFASSLHIRDQAAPRFLNSVIVNATKLGSAGPLEIDNRATTTGFNTVSNFTTGLAALRGVTLFSTAATYTSFATTGANPSWVQNGSNNSAIATEFVKAVNGNNPNDNPGFVNLPTGGNLNASLLLDPRPSTITDGAVYNEEIAFASASFVPVGFRGAFDANEPNLWTADWTAADAYGLIVK